MIGLISDTHDNVENILKAVKVFKDRNVRFVLHLGDIIAPATVPFFQGLSMKFITGNCDGDLANLKKIIHEQGWEYLGDIVKFSLGAYKCAAYHGQNRIKLDWMINSQEFNYVFHGHTHQKRDEIVGKTRVINPGAHYYTAEEKTVAIFDAQNNQVEFIELGDKDGGMHIL
ncbi:MAG: YfcE family phosphodiesterase [archaeon]